MTTRDDERPSGRGVIASRILASFAITLVAFAITVGFSVYSARRAAEANEELAKDTFP
ncbi:MAG: hypothetical protein U0169_01245 [Polyangiaceae bacterium]